ALDRCAGRAPVIVLTPDVDSVVARYADLLVPLHAGEEKSGLGCRAYQHALALLLLLGHRLGAPTPGSSGNFPGLVRRVANATKALLTSAPEWLPEAARVLDSPDGLHVVAPATRVCSAWQGMRALRQGPVRKALACETGEWSHSDRYLAAITDCRALLFAGSVYDERFAEHLGQLRGSFVSVGPTPGRERVPGAELTVRYPGDTDPDVSLLTEPLVAELLAAHRWHASGRCGADGLVLTPRNGSRRRTDRRTHPVRRPTPRGSRSGRCVRRRRPGPGRRPRRWTDGGRWPRRYDRG